MSARRRGAPPIRRWHLEDVLEIHPFDAEQRGIVDGDLVSLVSRAGDTALRGENHQSACSRAWSTPRSIIPAPGPMS